MPSKKPSVIRAKKRRKYLRAHPNARENMRLGARGSDVLENSILRKMVLDGYGRRCNCCGESNEKFLQIDHVHNDGNVERKGGGGRRRLTIFRKIIRGGFPANYQILCANCNWGKEMNGGVCPHIEIMANPKAHREATTTPPERTELPLAVLWNGVNA